MLFLHALSSAKINLPIRDFWIQINLADILRTRFRHISVYYQVMPNCETVSLLQFYKFFIKCWQCFKRNKLMRLNKIPWNEPEIFRILYQIGTKVRNWCFDLAMVCFIIRRLSLISNKNFLFSFAKMLKLSKE